MDSRPPYVLEKPSFRFVKLATQAGRAPVGGGREVALATLMLARMAHDTLTERQVEAELRAERALAVKGWLASMALPAPIRSALSDLAIATSGDASKTAPVLRRVIAVTANTLDSGARSELERLADALDAQALVKS